MTLRRPSWRVVAVALGILAIVAAVLFQLALRQMRGAIESALGPRASIESVSLGWSGLVLTNVRVRAERPRWPAEDELRAARIRVVPELSSAWRGEGWRVRRVEAEGAYVSVLRRRDGRLLVMPGLVRADPKAPKGAASPQVTIGRIELVDAAVEFFDGTVRQPPHRLRLEAVQATVDGLAFPALDRPVEVDLQAVFKGPKRDGSVAIAGQVTPSTRDADVRVRLAGVDLIALEPYLLKVHEAGVRRGSLDLRIDAKVKQRQLRAPGVLVLQDLELASGGGVFGTFAGVPRQAVLAGLSRNGRIELAFTLEGRLDDPKFSVNEALALRIASGLAESLGVSIGGVVQGVGGVIKGLFGD